MQAPIHFSYNSMSTDCVGLLVARLRKNCRLSVAGGEQGYKCYLLRNKAIRKEHMHPLQVAMHKTRRNILPKHI